jgi:hypothetical protein
MAELLAMSEVSKGCWRGRRRLPVGATLGEGDIGGSSIARWPLHLSPTRSA